jgi:YD repeat-containing protein
VWTCRIQRTWYPGRCRGPADETGERGDATLLDFRQDGSLARRWYRDPRGSESTDSYDYDDAGRLVAMRSADSNGSRASRRYEYDAAGRLERLVVPDRRGGSRVAETHEYGDSGERSRTIHVEINLQSQSVSFFEGTDVAYSAPGAATVRTQYNAREQPTEVLFHGSGGRPLSRVDFLYDDAGHLVEESQIRFEPCVPPDFLAGMSPAQLNAVHELLGAGAAPARRLHRYDGRGHRIQTSESGPFGRSVKTVVYNDWGDPIEETSEDDDRQCSIDDQGQIIASAPGEHLSRAQTRYHYDYDARGNWLKKVVQSRGSADQDFSTASIEERTLTFYD